MLSSLPLLVVCFALGMLGRRVFAFPRETPNVLNKVILFISLPALVLKALHRLTFTPLLLLGATMMWLEFALAFVVFALLLKKTLPAKAAGALVLTAGLANTAYLGLPMISGLLGEHALGPAVVVDQLGSFLMLSTAGIAVAAHAAGHAWSPGKLVRRLVTFPPFVALVVALATRRLAFPAPVGEVLQRLGDLLTPLALVSVGFSLELRGFRANAGRVAAGLTFKLVAAPMLVFGVFSLLGGRGMEREVVVLQSAMAPMVTGGILATEYGLEPRLAAAMVGFGIPLSFLTIPLWHAVMG